MGYVLSHAAAPLYEDIQLCKVCIYFPALYDVDTYFSYIGLAKSLTYNMTVKMQYALYISSSRTIEASFRGYLNSNPNSAGSNAL